MNGDATPLGPGAEFDLIRRLLDRWGVAARGVGDDAAILDVPPGRRLVVSTDAMVDTVHFRREWLSPDEIGYRVTTAALSDLAAMGATPVGLVLALVVPARDVAMVEAMAGGIGEAAVAAGCPIVGGDTTRGDRLCLTTTVFGAAEAPVRRSGARVGDAVVMTGQLGGPAAALRALARGEPPAPAHRQRLVRPVARIREGQWLALHGATALIDVSDGLASELRHLAAASRVRIAVELERLPVVPGVTVLEAAVAGEEFELVGTLPDDVTVSDFERAFDVPLTRIGRVTPGAPEVVFTHHGVRVDPGSGYDHFSP